MSITCAVFVEHDRVDQTLGSTKSHKWSVVDSNLSPDEAASVIRAWASRGYAVRVETTSPQPHDQTVS